MAKTKAENKFMGRPNEKQKRFFLANTRFIAYGGSRGGGKSWAVRKKAALICIRYPGIRVLLLRRSYSELRENHIRPLQAELKDIARYKESEKVFLFCNKSVLKFGYCDSENDVLQYQGQEYDIIFIDEATQFSEFQFKTLTAALRGANNFPKRMYLTCNPGGVGHAWVKRLFIDKEYTAGENAEDYTFIPANVYDNKALTENDSGYVNMLKGLPSQLRRAWLDGDWNVFSGQYFTEWREDVHVIPQKPIPPEWRRYFTMDYGLDMLAGYWIAVDTNGRAQVYREIYEKGLLISDAAALIKAKTPLNERIYGYFAPPDMWNRRQDTGKSVAEIFLQHGIALTKAQNSRVAGWLDLKEWLKVTETETGELTAALRVQECCKNLIRCMPALQYDEKNPNDVSVFPHEITHAPDAIRYFTAGRPVPPEIAADEFNGAGELEEWQEILNYGA